MSYTYQQLGERKSEILQHCEDVRRENPAAWRNAHNGSFDRESRRFNDLCVQRLRARGFTVGLNGKRGDPNSKSDDILNFPLVAGQGGAQDRSGRFAEIAIIDFIGAAGSRDPDHPPYIAWIDQSKAAPGYFLDPEGLASDVSGYTPPPPVPTPVPPVSTPPPSTDLSTVKAQLATLIEQQHIVMQMLNGLSTPADAGVYDLIDKTLINVHVDRIVKDLDRIIQKVGA